MEYARQLFLRLRNICARTAIAFLLSLFAVSLTPGLGHAQASDDTAYVRIIHASPFVGAADVFVDGKGLLNNFEFGAVTDYVAIPPGVHHVQIALVGKGIDASVVSQDLTVNAGAIYTVAALGTAANQLSLEGFIDDNQVAAGQARVRFYHLAPDAGSVSVGVGEDANIPTVAYKQASDYVTVDPGPCTFTVTSSENPGNKQLNTTLKENTVTSVFSVGLFKGTPGLQLVYAQTPGTPQMPNTGSDPTPRSPALIAPPTGLLAGSGIVLLGGGAVLFWGRQRKRQAQRAR